MNYAGKNVLVIGMARTGLATAEYLIKRGAHVTLNDMKPETACADEIARAGAIGAEAVVGGHPEEIFLRADFIAISPGVPMALPAIVKAQSRGIPVLGDMEIAFDEMKGRVCAITGSNGKTTTTALTGRIFSDAGLKTVIAGNIGTPLISFMDHDSRDTWFVCEMSSFQLESIDHFRPCIASILNLTPDHLDRYNSFESYADAKRRIYRNQTTDDFLVLNGDDPLLRHEEARSRTFLFSRKLQLKEGCFLQGDGLMLSSRNGSGVLMPLARIPLKGDHNIENVMAAALMAHLAGIPSESIRRSVEEFRAVAHRLQFVATIRGVDFYNDSKATNVDATIKAIESFTGNLILILGGKDKGGSYAPIRDLCPSHVKLGILIGQAADKIEAALTGACPLARVGSLEKAVETGFERATAGDTVLLAPACASFDMFHNFEHRGDVFMQAVRGT